MTEPFSQVTDTALLAEPVESGNKEILLGFSLRNHGTSSGPFESLNLGLHVHDQAERVRQNRHILAGHIGFPLDRWVCAEQVHGTTIARATLSMAGSGALSMEDTVGGTDGLFTTETGLLLALCFADCVPIYFYCLEPAAVAMLHAGWRGSVANGAGKMVARLEKELGIGPDAIHAVIGPAIGGDDYEVDERVAGHVRQLPQAIWETAVRMHGTGHYLLDLQALNRAMLEAAGVPGSQIRVTGYTTFANPKIFFSYRRDQGSTGRMMGFIGIRKKEQATR
ncbi:peptidoglycan editing factor PgeF [Sporolactobacillus vineae]|uniref:peptidoglycan editing factor PgeF n=1 Tax=Sporolactobacillus vineae TaxID=444463 RepID=UPI000288A31F|nr:peptidoglycan editing factor PgeF [Sporolactobacillus vineae]